METNYKERLTEEQIEQLAIDIRTFLLKEEIWQDVDIYFNGKSFSTFDKKSNKHYYNNSEHLVINEDEDPSDYFEYINENHILSMSFEGPVCHMMYYGSDSETKKKFDKIFEKYGLYYEFGDHWNCTCYYI